MITKTLKNGMTCVGDLRLSSLDVGFDLRLNGMAIRLPEKFDSVGLQIKDNTYLITGTREEMIAAIKSAGYTALDSDKP